MKERSEEEMVGMLPIEVTLGTEQYKIPALPILKQREWRVKLNTEMCKVLSGFGETATFNAVQGGFAAALIKFPEVVGELLFAYAPELPKETILAEATEEQLNLAFSKLMVVAYPFLASLGTVTKAMQMQAIQPA